MHERHRFMETGISDFLFMSFREYRLNWVNRLRRVRIWEMVGSAAKTFRRKLKKSLDMQNGLNK